MPALWNEIKTLDLTNKEQLKCSEPIIYRISFIEITSLYLTLIKKLAEIT